MRLCLLMKISAIFSVNINILIYQLSQFINFKVYKILTNYFKQFKPNLFYLIK